jgi:hypothetical protein
MPHCLKIPNKKHLTIPQYYHNIQFILKKEICNMNKRIYSYKANLQTKQKFEAISERTTTMEYPEQTLSPEDFDFNDYEETEYDSLEDK